MSFDHKVAKNVLKQRRKKKLKLKVILKSENENELKIPSELDAIIKLEASSWAEVDVRVGTVNSFWMAMNIFLCKSSNRFASICLLFLVPNPWLSKFNLISFDSKKFVQFFHFFHNFYFFFCATIFFLSSFFRNYLLGCHVLKALLTQRKLLSASNNCFHFIKRYFNYKFFVQKKKFAIGKHSLNSGQSC